MQPGGASLYASPLPPMTVNVWSVLAVLVGVVGIVLLVWLARRR